MHFGVQQRLTLAWGLYGLVVFAAGGLLFYEQTRRSMEQELGDKLLAVGSIVAATISGPERQVLAASGIGSRTSRSVSNQLAQSRDSAGLDRLYVFGRDGRSLADADPRQPGEVYPELEFEQAALASVFAGRRVVGHLFTGREGRIYKSAFLPLPAGGDVQAGLAVVGSATFLDAISNMRNGLILAVCVSIGGSILLSLVLARTIVNPIRKLVAAAHRIGEGDLETSVPNAGRDEIGYLGRTLERMRTAVLARERSLRAMIGGVAHEIRNPLGGIELFAGLLKRRVRDDAEASGSVDRIVHEVRHLDGIIKDFLDFARPSEPERRRFRVSTVADEVAEVLSGTLTQSGVTLELDCQDVEIDADPAQIRQVLTNLVLNAVQAQESGGCVSITARNRAGGVEVRVEDEGPGIAEELRERVFEPFFTTRQQGSGLGLPIAQSLVQRNGGMLEIESGRVRGTAIVMRWPGQSGGRS